MISVYNFPYLLRQSVLDLKPNGFIETGCKTLTVDEMIGYIISYQLTPEQENKIRAKFGIAGPVKTTLPDMNEKYEKLMKILPGIFDGYKIKLTDIKSKLNAMTGGGIYYFTEEKLISNYTNMDKLGYIIGGATPQDIETAAKQVTDVINSFDGVIESIKSKITSLSGSESDKNAEIERLTKAIVAAKAEGETALAEAKAEYEKAKEDAVNAANEAAAADAAAKAAEAQAQIEAANAALEQQKNERTSESAKFVAILGQLKTALETKKESLNAAVNPTTGGAILKKLNGFFELPKFTGRMDAGKLRDNYHKIKQYISKNAGVYSKMVGGNADIMGLGMQGINNYSDMRNLMAQSLGMTQQPMPMSGQQMVPALFQQYSNQLLQNDPLRAAIMQQIPAMKFQ